MKPMREAIDLTDLLRQYVQIQWFEIVGQTAEHLSRVATHPSERAEESVAPGLLTASYPDELFNMTWRPVTVPSELANAALRAPAGTSNSPPGIASENRGELDEQVLNPPDDRITALPPLGRGFNGVPSGSAIERIRHEHGALAGAVFEHMTADLGELEAVLFGLYAGEYFVWEVFREVDGVSVQEAINGTRYTQQQPGSQRSTDIPV